MGDRKPALLVRLRGGLGNQLFEYAAARALALRNDVPLRLDKTSGFRGDRYGRSYELGSFRVVDGDGEQASSVDLGLRAELFRRFVERREMWRMRSGRYFDPAIRNLCIKRPMVLDAYCQSPRYFCDIEEVLTKELEFKTYPVGLSEATVEDIAGSNSICLHVRRQFAQQVDGSTSQAVAEFYGKCGIAYYQRAIREVSALHGVGRIFIFSDDIQWAQQNAAAFEIAGCSVKVIDDEDPLRSFYLMRLCKHFIIANSTFSWWAAWLGKDPAKTVCVPSVWNRQERCFPRDLFPPAWRIIASKNSLPAVNPLLNLERKCELP